MRPQGVQEYLITATAVPGSTRRFFWRHPLKQAVILFLAGMALSLSAGAQNISIATGGTGGVYYPMGGGIAAVLSKHVPGMQATAEVTGGSVDNLKLVGTGKRQFRFRVCFV